MKCENHPGVDSIDQCAVCSVPLCGICANFTDSGVLCERCVQNQVNSAFVDSQNKPSDDFKKMLNEPAAVSLAPKKQRIEESIEKREKMHIAIVILSCVFIAVRLFTSIGSPGVLNQSQVQAEELAIQQRTLCVQVFWEIAALLQEGELPNESLRCGELGVPNIISRVGDDIIVTHPNPRLLGFSELSVSKSNPIPRVQVL